MLPVGVIMCDLLQLTSNLICCLSGVWYLLYGSNLSDDLHTWKTKSSWISSLSNSIVYYTSAFICTTQVPFCFHTLWQLKTYSTIHYTSDVLTSYLNTELLAVKYWWWIIPLFLVDKCRTTFITSTHTLFLHWTDWQMDLLNNYWLKKVICFVWCGKTDYI